MAKAMEQGDSDGRPTRSGRPGAMVGPFRMAQYDRNIIWIKVIAVCILPAFIMLFSGCVEGDRETLTFTNISPQEARSRLEQESGVILLDVRTPAEYLEQHIPGSLLIPVDRLEQDAPSLLPDRSATIFIYCRSGRRSVTAANILLELGYTGIYNLGGIIDWPFETTGGAWTAGMLVRS